VTDETIEQPASPVPQLERGKVYESIGPSGEKIALMTHDTWVDFNTAVESLRQMARHFERSGKELKSDYDVLLKRFADTQTRLDNLRAVRRAEKRPEVEKYFEQPEPNKVTEHVRAAINESNT
jgi:hypothetical protein